jgi:hypothetical protein
MIELMNVNKKINKINDSTNIIINNLAINQMKENNNFCQYMSKEITKMTEDENYVSESLERTTTPHKNHLKISEGNYLTVTDKGLGFFKEVIDANNIKREIDNNNLNLKEYLSLGSCLYTIQNPFSETPHTDFVLDYMEGFKEDYKAKTLMIIKDIQETFKDGEFENTYRSSLKLQTAANSLFFSCKEKLLATEIMSFSYSAKQANSGMNKGLLEHSIKKFQESSLFKNEEKLSIKQKI